MNSSVGGMGIYVRGDRTGNGVNSAVMGVTMSRRDREQEGGQLPFVQQAALRS